MIINDLDLGLSHPWRKGESGGTLGSVFVDRQGYTLWHRGAALEKQQVSFWVKAWQPLGGNAADSAGALEALLIQAKELAKNPGLNPVYIRWARTADPAASFSADTPEDGWYLIDNFKPDRQSFIYGGAVQCAMTVTLVQTGGSARQMAMNLQGGQLVTAYTGAAYPHVAYPLGSVAGAPSFTSRAGAEGAIPVSEAPSTTLGPLPFQLSLTVSDWFKGGARVYDTINTVTYPVPVSGVSTAYVNAGWVEVKYSDHVFVGDCVLTNGLLMLLFNLNSPTVCGLYVWSSALATPAWQKFADLNCLDNASNPSRLRSFGLQRVGRDACQLQCYYQSAGLIPFRLLFRLEAGAMFCRVGFNNRTQANTNPNALLLTANTRGKILYSSQGLVDDYLGPVDPTRPYDYGYGGILTPYVNTPYVYGWLHQGPVNTSISTVHSNQNGNYGFGDSNFATADLPRWYGIFAAPMAGAQYLQAEAENYPGGSWVSVADAAASGGNALQVPSGTLAPAIQYVGPTAFTPAFGAYTCWVRGRVTAQNSAANQIVAGLNSGAGDRGHAIVSANGWLTTYAWYPCSNPGTPGLATYALGVADTNPQFYVGGLAGVTTTTDFWIDQFALVPVNAIGAYFSPQELWQQFMFDRESRLLRV